MRLLMCPPEHFEVTYEINAWMRIANGPDPDKARTQWQALHTILREEVGAEVSLVAPQVGLPDMVFTANAGLTKGEWFVPSRFRPIERQGEVAFFIQWMLENGFSPQAADRRDRRGLRRRGRCAFLRRFIADRVRAAFGRDGLPRGGGPIRRPRPAPAFDRRALVSSGYLSHSPIARIVGLLSPCLRCRSQCRH